MFASKEKYRLHYYTIKLFLNTTVIKTFSVKNLQDNLINLLDFTKNVGGSTMNKSHS